MDYSLPGSSVHGISQARILEWVAISFCRGFCNPGIEPVPPTLQVDSLQLSYQLYMQYYDGRLAICIISEYSSHKICMNYKGEKVILQ